MPSAGRVFGAGPRRGSEGSRPAGSRRTGASRGTFDGVASILLATTAYGILHSVLASRAAKGAAARVLGADARKALYRPFYLVQSVVTFGALLAHVRRQPRVTLYRVPPPWSLLMRAGQTAGLGYAVWAAWQVGVPGMLGLSGLGAWVRRIPPPVEPEAQGPAAETEERMRVRGPFRWHRHPLNFAPLPVLWLFPLMTTRLLALNLASTGYLVLGSLHEEHRLRRAYGDAYVRYQTSGVPFFLPLGGRRVGGALRRTTPAHDTALR